jgi:outer membrane biosynthesis protein TonB
MTGVGARFDSLRLSSPEMRRLGLALVLSLAVHLLGWGGYEADKQLGLSQRLHWPTWLPRLAIMKIMPAPTPQNNEPQLTFVEVAQPAPEAPPEAKYYSSQNSRAADPTKGNKEIPQLNGKQTEVVKTENVPRPNFNKLQPATPAPQQKSQPAAVRPGDLTLGKPENSQQQEQERPRTIKQALAQQSHQLPGQQMKQDGGMHRAALVSSLDVKATPFGAYDGAFIAAVTQRWYDLLDSRQFSMDRSGKVTLQFHLNYDGSIADMKVLDNTVGDVLGYVCQKAVTDPAPFSPWPTEMRRLIGENYREITFTFYYY